MDRELYLQQLEGLWAEHWPAGFPREAEYPFGEVLITDYLRQRARLTPERPCVIYYGEAMTFRQLNDYSDRFASYLSSQGLQKGDRVAVLMPNCPQFLIAFYGTLKLGCIHVPINPLFKEAEFVHEMQDAEPRALLALDLFFPLVRATWGRFRLDVVLVTSLTDWLPAEPTLPIPDLAKVPRRNCAGAADFMMVLKEETGPCPPVAMSLDDTAALNYTGGTTGMPKGCEHTHRSMLYTAACAATFAHCQPGEDDVSLTYVPIFWIAGEDGGVLVPVLSGVPEVLLTRWDARAVLEAIQTYRVSIAYGLVDNFVELMEHPDIGQYDLSSLRVTMVSSFVKKLNKDYRNRWRELTGCTLREGSYGMTETHTLDTYTSGLQADDMDLESRPMFVGLPMPGTRFMVVDFATGAPLPLGQEGEILIQTPSLMKSYWRKPDETARQLKGGWLHTGDIGMIDERGFLIYLGRNKEMLKVKGMSVFPSEIEALLGQHPAVVGSAVLGRPDEGKGEVPVAFVQLDSTRTGQISAADLTAYLTVWCRQNMAGYKVPEIRIVEQLPLTTTGKVQKERLRKEL